MKEALGVLRDVLACAPVRVQGLGPAVAMLLEVDAWAARACQRLGFKVKGEGPQQQEMEKKEEGDGIGGVGRRRERERQRERLRRAEDADPGKLLRRLALLYKGKEGLSVERMAGVFKGLEALEEALADMVEMVRVRVFSVRWKCAGSAWLK